MRSRTTRQFRQRMAALPDDVQQQARRAYRLFEDDPWHNSLRFKRIHPIRSIYSVRIGKGYRAVGLRSDAGMLWFWVGSHADYDQLVKNR